jgi:hypothetical protein
MDSVGRRIFGPGVEYPATSRDSSELATAMANSMQERRTFGWEVVRRAVSPVSVPNLTKQVPAFMTWYAEPEIGPFFEGVLQNLTPDRRAQLQQQLACIKDPRCAVCMRGKPRLDDEEVRAAMAAAAASSPTNMTDAQFAALLQQIATGDAASQAGSGMQHLGFAGFSTSFVRHVFENFYLIMNCHFNDDPNLDLQNAASFSSCIPEFPKDAVMFKTKWIRANGTIPNFDMSASGFDRAFNGGSFQGADVPVPSGDSIYRIKDRDGNEWALAAIHLVTKETRQWVWTSLSWSGAPNDDLGQDRPSSIPAPFNHYKLTVTTTFMEGDPTPWTGADGREIAALRELNTLKKTTEQQLTSWGSDPHIEQGDPRSNCVGCHGGAFGQNTQARKNFPSDFSFGLQNMGFPLNDALTKEGLNPPPTSARSPMSIKPPICPLGN